MKIDDEPERLVLQHTFPESTSNFAIQSLHTSPDGAWLATKRSGAESGTVQLYSIVENDYKHWWSLPALESPISAARFIEGEKPLLVVSCSNCAVYVFDVQARSLSNWSEELGVPMQEKLPDELGHRADFPVRVASNPATPNMFLLVSIQLLLSLFARTLLWHALTLRSRVALSLLQYQCPLLSPASEAFPLACGIIWGDICLSHRNYSLRFRDSLEPSQQST
jgi:WD40 repeat protein